MPNGRHSSSVQIIQMCFGYKQKFYTHWQYKFMPITQKKELLQKIQAHSRILQKKILSYGISSKQLIQILKSILINILNLKRSKLDQIKNVSDIMNAMNRQLCRKPSIAADLLIQIIGKIDEQVGELQSSEDDCENKICKEECMKSQIKLEDKQNQGGQLNLIKKASSNSLMSQPLVIVKIETIPQDYLSEEIPPEDQPVKRKKKGKSSSRQRKKQQK